MENLLALEAEAKYLFGATDRPYEQKLKDELLKIVEEAELFFGPRDRSYELLAPRLTECGFAHPRVLPFRKIRIYLTRFSKTRYYASLELAHETVHVLGPTEGGATVLEEGLATYFSHRYVDRVYGLQFEEHPMYAAAMGAVAPLLAKNEFVIKELRVQQPQISKIDERLLVEVAGIEPDQAKYLCSDLRVIGRTSQSRTEYAAQGGQLFVNGFRSIWDQWKSGCTQKSLASNRAPLRSRFLPIAWNQAGSARKTTNRFPYPI